MELIEKIEAFFSQSVDQINRTEACKVFREFKELLNEGKIRAAEPEPENNSWKVNQWVKKGILLGFKIGLLTEYTQDELFQYFDKHTMKLHEFSLSDNVRIVPGGTSVRDGSYIGKGVVIMPPAYVNIGAYVGEDTMIDSHALIGSCAQIGKKVHISAAAQIGGVLEPIGSLPVIIEDEVLIGGNCGIYEGTIIKRQCVIASGVIITGSTPVYDLVERKIYRRTETQPLIIPENAVVVSGARPVKNEWGQLNNISIYTPIIIKYRDEKTDLSAMLEEMLR